MTHLKRKHPTTVNFSDSSQSVASLGLGNSDRQPSIVISKRRQKNITRALTRIITFDMRPPHMMKGLGFLSAMKEIEPSYVVPHPTTFTRTIKKSGVSSSPEAYQEMKSLVIKKLEDSIHLTMSTDL